MPYRSYFIFQVYETFDNLNSMTEHFDKNKLNEMNTTDNPRIWTRLCDKLIIKSGNNQNSFA